MRRDYQVRKVFSGIISLVFLISSLGAVDITVNEDYFNDAMVSFYLSDFDLENPQNNQLVFRYRISDKGSNECMFANPVEVSLEFKLRAKIYSLGWTGFREIATVTLSPFELLGPMSISNQLLGSNVDEQMLQYDCPEIAPFVDLDGGQISINSENFSAISNVIFATNKLPGGQYSFVFTVYNESEGNSSTVSREVNISAPTNLQLISPGINAISSGEFEQIFTKYPAFQWDSENCTSCNYFIRISRYDGSIHNSALSALQDESSLPFPDDGEFFPLGININSYNYDPSFAGLELEFGYSYVWQIKKEFGTSSGTTGLSSEIYGYTVVDPSSGNVGTGIPTDPVSTSLKVLIGEDRFTQFFSSGGDLDGFVSSGKITLNGNSISVGELDALRAAIENGSYTIQNISVE